MLDQLGSDQFEGVMQRRIKGGLSRIRRVARHSAGILAPTEVLVLDGSTHAMPSFGTMYTFRGHFDPNFS